MRRAINKNNRKGACTRAYNRTLSNEENRFGIVDASQLKKLLICFARRVERAAGEKFVNAHVKILTSPKKCALVLAVIIWVMTQNVTSARTEGRSSKTFLSLRRVCVCVGTSEVRRTDRSAPESTHFVDYTVGKEGTKCGRAQ